MGASGFWDDQARAAKVSAEHSRLSRRLEEFRSLESDVADLEELETMADDDESILSEVRHVGLQRAKFLEAAAQP